MPQPDGGSDFKKQAAVRSRGEIGRRICPNGAEASVNAKAVLEENNISHDHRSSTLTREDIDWATLVLTMTQSHKGLIINQYPFAADKTFTLKEFADVKENLDVADPFGGNEQIYRQAFKEIQKSIERILDKIR
ncbi:low molecular weight protein tyrosine phosphatase [Mesobacillus boroniphilus JCM 21738]|uniref:Low molecular weight protein tyrosine phosphatase n=1 Tax=Mesobacillus boroniphilus JCM 21738 TaxID=1294265 RepID=W4RSC3_9BACI|nr:low molecular weight protein tyrosine phosphatase [Mesobacillus boroniphilus JCM 21738]